MNGTTSRFSRHEACPSCGSRDNLARYESGSGYCFGCGHTERGVASAVNLALRGLATRRQEQEGGIRPPPDDCGTHYGRNALDWIAKYHMDVPTLIRHNVKWSPSREQLIYLFYGAGTDVVLWQARNFRAGTGHKDRFFTGGTPADVLATYNPQQSSSTAVIVEDCVSGIRVAEAGFVGVPCFSAALSKQKLARLRRYYSNMVVWLDEDKLKESQKIATQCALLGFHSKVVHTDKDPKEYSNEEVRNYVEA